MSLVLRNALLICCDENHHTLEQDLVVKDGRIAEFRPPGSDHSDCEEIIDCSNRWVMPSFVQTHTHLVQTLFRGLADDLELLDWLSTRIWPMEAAHDPESVYWSARLGITELLLGGTGAILDMATVHHTDSVFEAARESGIRAHIGQAMMDRPNGSGLSMPTDALLTTSCDLADRWHQKGRLHYAYAPRFVPSCTEDLLKATVQEARQRRCLLHTHASENLDEVAHVRELTGMDNVAYLHDIGLSGPDVVLAHCIHLTDAEQQILAQTQTTVAHCPGSNMKLGSGIAPIPELMSKGVRCTIGADGAPCNNRLDIFAEMRLAALMQKPRLGAQFMPAHQVLDMATRHGASALGLPSGSLEIGKDADLVLINPQKVHAWGGGEPASALVYAMTPACIERVWIQGDLLVENGSVIGWSTEETIEGCQRSLRRIMETIPT